MNKVEQRFLPYLGVVSDRQIAEAAGLKLPAVSWWRQKRNVKGLGIQASALDPYMHWFANSVLTPDKIFEIAGERLPRKAMKAFGRDPQGMAMRLARRAAFLCAYEGLRLQPVPPNLSASPDERATLWVDRIERGQFSPSPYNEDQCDLLRQQRGAVVAQLQHVLAGGRPGADKQAEGERRGESVSPTPSQPFTDITVSFKLAIVRGAEAYLSPEEVEASVRQALTCLLSEGDLMTDLPDEIIVGMRMKQAAVGGDDWDIAVVFGD